MIIKLALLIIAYLAARAWLRERRYQRAERAVAMRLVYKVRNPADEALTREMWRQHREKVDKIVQDSRDARDRYETQGERERIALLHRNRPDIYYSLNETQLAQDAAALSLRSQRVRAALAMYGYKG